MADAEEKGVRMRRTTVWMGMLLAGWLLAGCAGMDITNDFDDTYSFQDLKTFTWMPAADQGKRDPRFNNDLFDARVKRALQTNLEGKGYTLVAEGATADFRVGYQALLQDKMSAKTISNYYGYQGTWGVRYWSPAGATQNYVYEYEQGTLLIDLVDGVDKRLVWRGSAQAEVDRKGSSERREKRLNEAVKKILEGFPPQ
jgi:hypothetical protein